VEILTGQILKKIVMSTTFWSTEIHTDYCHTCFRRNWS